ncbi:hypothetical protein ACIPSE_45910 [Streptomyces sp. NPDC090106]|uniref:hypothetical protein n=1 Tax=Streptomyces sp. NPDC090106 TaxID=3365946 RepID=UPI0038098F33
MALSTTRTYMVSNATADSGRRIVFSSAAAAGDVVQLDVVVNGRRPRAVLTGDRLYGGFFAAEIEGVFLYL